MSSSHQDHPLDHRSPSNRSQMWNNGIISAVTGMVGLVAIVAGYLLTDQYGVIGWTVLGVGAALVVVCLIFFARYSRRKTTYRDERRR